MKPDAMPTKGQVKTAKIKSQKEMLKINAVLTKTCQALIRDYDKRIVEANNKVDAAIKERDQLIESHEKAPNKIRQYQLHSLQITKELKTLTSSDGDVEKIKSRIRSLRERLAKFEKELQNA